MQTNDSKGAATKTPGVRHHKYKPPRRSRVHVSAGRRSWMLHRIGIWGNFKADTLSSLSHSISSGVAARIVLWGGYVMHLLNQESIGFIVGLLNAQMSQASDCWNQPGSGFWCLTWGEEVGPCHNVRCIIPTSCFTEQPAK